LRIEQPEHLRPLYVESFRRNTRLGVRGCLVLSLVLSAITLGSLALQVSAGQPVAPWQWLGGVGIGPLGVALLKGALRLLSAGNRFAEIRGNWVRLGPVGYTFRPSLLVHCKIEPDNNFPEVNRLCFCFRLSRLTRPRYWSMMVEELGEAEEFLRQLSERAA
jgi:hypothetical protein